MCQGLALPNLRPEMYIFDSVVPDGTSGEVPLCTSFEAASTPIEVVKARRKQRSDHRVSPGQSFRTHDTLFQTRDSRNAGINKFQRRPYHAFNPRPGRLEIYCHQTNSVILKQMSSQVCLHSARTNSQPLGTAKATTPKTMVKTTASLILEIGETDSGSLFGDIQPLLSQQGVETSWVSFFEVASSRKSLPRSPSLSTSDGTKPIRDPRSIDLEPASTMFTLGSSEECIIQDSNFHSDLSSTCRSELSIDREGTSWLDEESKIVESVNSNSLLGYEHRSKSVNSEVSSAKIRIVKSLMEEFWIMFDPGFQSVAAQPETASSSVISEDKSSEPSSTAITSQGNKRSRTSQRGHEADEEQDNDENRSKKPKMTSLPSNEKENRKFACPYRKHDPRKYSIQHWRSCALTPLETVARVK